MLDDGCSLPLLKLQLVEAKRLKHRKGRIGGSTQDYKNAAEAAKRFSEFSVEYPQYIAEAMKDQQQQQTIAEYGIPQVEAFGEGLTKDKEGVIWRLKKKKTELSGNHSLTKIQAYVKDLGSDKLAPSESTA